MDIELRHLRLVRAIAEAGTQRRAAERLFATQSALSQQLRLLEDRLGGSLFDRSGRRMRPTAAGERLLAAAEAILPQAERAEAEVRALASGEVGLLRFATACYLSYGWLPPLLKAYGAAWPGVEVRIVAEAAEEPVRHLLARSLDVALVTLTDANAVPGGIEVVPLFEDDLVALVSEGHSWATSSSVPAAAFADEHLCVAPAALDPSKPLGRLLRERGVSPGRLTELPPQAGVAVEMARAGLGVTVLAAWAAEPEVERGGLVAVRVGADGVRLSWAAAVRDEQRPPYLDAFVDALNLHNPRGTAAT